MGRRVGSYRAPSPLALDQSMEQSSPQHRDGLGASVG
eukprot:gene11013-23565_t